MNRFYYVGGQDLEAYTQLRIIVDLLTGVNYTYMICTGGSGLSGLTPLLDEDGEVIVSSGFELERYREESGFNKSSGKSFNPVW